MKIQPKQGGGTPNIMKGKPQVTQPVQDITVAPPQQSTANPANANQANNMGRNPMMPPQQKQPKANPSAMILNKKIRNALIEAGVAALQQMGVRDGMKSATKMNIMTNRMFSPLFKRILMQNKGGSGGKQVDIVIDELLSECKY